MKWDETRQNKTKLDEIRWDEIRQKTKLDEMRQDQIRWDETKQDKN